MRNSSEAGQAGADQNLRQPIGDLLKVGVRLAPPVIGRRYGWLRLRRPFIGQRARNAKNEPDEPAGEAGRASENEIQPEELQTARERVGRASRSDFNQRGGNERRNEKDADY